MNEDVEVAARAGTGLAHQACAARLEARYGARQIGHFDGDVMQPFAALVDEFGDYRITVGSFEQFDARIARGQHGDVDFFLIDRFTEANREAQLIFVENQRGVERTDGNAEMINLESV